MRKILLIIFALCALTSSAFVNLSETEYRACEPRNAVLFGDAIIRCFGLDSILRDYESKIRWRVLLSVDSIGNVVAVRRFSKINVLTNQHYKMPDEDADKLKDFFIANKIRFGSCYAREFDIPLSQERANYKKYYKPEKILWTQADWPYVWTFAEDRAEMLLEAVRNNVAKYLPTLNDDERGEVLYSDDLSYTTESYNSGLLLLCLTYIIGDYEMLDWLEGEPFKVDIVVDRDGLPLSVSPATHGTSPIDKTIAGLMEDFFKSYNIRFKIPNGSMSDSAKDTQYPITVDFPFSPQVMENLNPDINLNQIYRLSRTLIDK